MGHDARAVGVATVACKVLGVAFLALGVLGFLVPDLLGTHLSAAHSIVHLLSGALAATVGWKGTARSAAAFCLIFGAVYGLLGVAGFVAGQDMPPSAGIPGPHDGKMLKVIPGVLELGTMDHVVHVLLGGVFLACGLWTRRALA
jgi:hypothetical protein